MSIKEKVGKSLVDILKEHGVSKIGSDGEVVLADDAQSAVASSLEKAGFGLVVATTSQKLDSGMTMYRIVAQPKSIEDIINSVTPENSEMLADTIRRDPTLRSVQMNMIAFD
tara:strand:+ start:12513 stop:12848 length:336 start_codon:yes stop_codon:yes gene_type:complete